MPKRTTNVQNKPLPIDHQKAVVEAFRRRDELDRLILIAEQDTSRSPKGKAERIKQLKIEHAAAHAIAVGESKHSLEEQLPINDGPPPAREKIPGAASRTATGRVKA